MQKKAGFMLLGAILLSVVTLGSIGLGQADETGKYQVIQTQQNVGKINNGITKSYLTRGELAIELVNTLDLNLDGFRFLKAPEVTDLFNDVPVSNPCARAVMILGYNGIVGEPGRLFRPEDKITREELAQMLVNLLHQRARDNALNVEVSSDIKDLSSATAEAADDIKTVVGLNIMTLDQDSKFRPKGSVTQEDLNAILEKLEQVIKVNDNGVTAKILNNKEGNREVEVSWGQKPSSGYEIKIVDLRLNENTLIVNYHTREPAPGSYNSTVITEPKDSKPIPANFPAQLKIELHKI